MITTSLSNEWQGPRRNLCEGVRETTLARLTFVALQEYTGIDAERVEQMEQRLKADIVKEAGLHDGRLLIAREVMGSQEGQSASIVDDFVPIQGPAFSLQSCTLERSRACHLCRDYTSLIGTGTNWEDGASSSTSIWLTAHHIMLTCWCRRE